MNDRKTDFKNGSETNWNIQSRINGKKVGLDKGRVKAE